MWTLSSFRSELYSNCDTRNCDSRLSSKSELMSGCLIREEFQVTIISTNFTESHSAGSTKFDLKLDRVSLSRRPKNRPYSDRDPADSTERISQSSGEDPPKDRKINVPSAGKGGEAEKFETPPFPPQETHAETSWMLASPAEKRSANGISIRASRPCALPPPFSPKFETSIHVHRLNLARILIPAQATDAFPDTGWQHFSQAGQLSRLRLARMENVSEFLAVLFVTW